MAKKYSRWVNHMTTDAILGIDIAKKKFDVALLRAGKYRNKVFANNETGFGELTAWLHKQRVEQVYACLEATGTYGEKLATYLHEAGHPVSMINPARIRAYAESQ